MQANPHEAHTRLPELVDRAHAGAIVAIASSGTPMARPVPPSDTPKRNVAFGLMEGEFEIPEDFDAPLPEAVLGLFEGKGGA